MRCKKSVWKKKDGSALITVMCVMALTLVLCLSLLLNASTMMQSASNQANRQQARVLAQSMGEIVSDNMEDADSSMAGTMLADIRGNAWPDYQKDTLGHSISDATRQFTMQYYDETAGDCAMSCYWIRNDPEDTETTCTLFVTISCTYKGQVCSITQSYFLASPYTVWEPTNCGANVEGSYRG